MALNYIDLAIICLLVYGLARGAYRGFFVEISSLLALVLGVFGALHFSSFTASLLANYIEWDYLPLLAFALTFIGIMIGVAWIGKLLTKLAKVVLLGFLNRLLGALFGACKWLVICGVLLWIVGQLDVFFSFLPESLKEDSLVFQPLEELGAYLFEKINTEENPIDNIPPILQQS
jgi:membrane protein required for colicin V production